MDLLEQAHVVTIPGPSFGAAGAGHLRVSYGSVSLADLDEGLGRMGRFFGGGDR
jgi:aspartate/methionine/tyrosine aminotransferase